MTRLRRNLLAVGLVASAMVAGSACVASADTIKIGVFGPLTEWGDATKVRRGCVADGGDRSRERDAWQQFESG